MNTNISCKKMTLNYYEDALTSYIQDDDKLITYKWLSKELEIHVNIAKDILKQYWKKHRDDKRIVATFLLVGQLKDKSIRMEVVRESNLNAAKDKFINVDCEHLYSLQNSLEDLELLVFAGEGDFHYSAIKCNNIKYERSNEEIFNLQYIESNKNTNKVLEKQILKKPESFSNTIFKNAINKNDSKERDKSEENEKFVESKSGTKITISEKKVSPLIKSLKSNSKVEEISIQPKKSGSNSLFAKRSNNLQISNKMKNLNSDKQKSLKIDKEIRNIPKNIEANNELKSKNRKDVLGIKRRHSQQNNISLKRKKIIVMDSSEDEVNYSEEEKQHIETESLIPNIVQRSSISSTEKYENVKHMIKKTIDKTFKDEDGYLVTKRIHVYETANDNNESIAIKKQEPLKLKPVKVQAKKQTTLMNFLKKF